MNIDILTEGGKNIGFGHLSRTLALADGFTSLNKDKMKSSKLSVRFIVNSDQNHQHLITYSKEGA